eukprot:jgi/Orpsp1_1/1184074/evm.model.c7180000087893.2
MYFFIYFLYFTTVFVYGFNGISEDCKKYNQFLKINDSKCCDIVFSEDNEGTENSCIDNSYGTITSIT